jgi:hypothetical protein
MRRPILSQMQWPVVHGGMAPLDVRIMDMVPPFQGVWHAAHWELENLALFNQAAYSDVMRRIEALDERAREIRSWVQPVEGDDEIESFQIMWSRANDGVISGEIEAEAISRYADEVTTVDTWAFAEKNLNRGLAELRTLLVLPAVSSHRWPDIQAAFQECGVDLNALDSFQDADECRRVNNTIKHSGVVSQGLAQCAFFAPHAGNDISSIELPTQRYYFGVADFVGAMFEKCSDIARNVP